MMESETKKTILITVIAFAIIGGLAYIFIVLNFDITIRSEVCQDMYPDEYSYTVYKDTDKYNCCYIKTVIINNQYSNEKVCVAMEESGFE